jgi:hypothetical protein
MARTEFSRQFEHTQGQPEPAGPLEHHPEQVGEVKILWFPGLQRLKQGNGLVVPVQGAQGQDVGQGLDPHRCLEGNGPFKGPHGVLVTAGLMQGKPEMLPGQRICGLSSYALTQLFDLDIEHGTFFWSHDSVFDTRIFHSNIPLIQ